MADVYEADDDVIMYQKGDDEIEDMSDHVNFSAALKNRRLGEALCKDNPAAKRKLETKISEINKQQRRRKADLYQKQREFFIQQIFAKGLNPFVKKIDVSGLTATGTASGHRLARQQSKVEQKVSFADGADSTPLDGDSKPVGTSLYRSHTVGDLSTSRVQQNNADHVTDPDDVDSFRNTRDHSWISAPRRYQQDYGLPRIPGPTASHMTIHDRRQQQLSPIREAIEAIRIPAPPNSRHLPDLKQNPELLFPKMKTILRENDSVDGVNRVTSRRGSMSPHRITLPQMTPRSSDDEEGQFGPKHVMKMINNLSTDLPSHLKSTATQQIREMTNADKFSAQKTKLKHENWPWLRRDRSLEDKRWFKLENSLSPRLNAEETYIWRRMSGSWTQCRKYEPI